MSLIKTGMRWAVQSLDGDSMVWRFFTATHRDAWVAKNPERRRAVGKRHPLVKAYRRRVTGRTNV